MDVRSLYIILSFIFIVMSFLPILQFKHWIFRISEYLRLQILGILCLLLVIGYCFESENMILHRATLILITISIIHHIIIILPYIRKSNKSFSSPENKVIILSVNVLQKNQNYKKLIDIIEEMNPDILLTMETNQKWENELSKVESLFSYNYKIPKENRYGMHLYTKLDVKECKEHYLISEEHPSIEIRMADKENNEFIFWGIHPPPPSPGEKPTSKQKDAELMKLAKLIRKNQYSTIVVGDFNNVSWSKSSKMFSKLSNLKDARVRRGIYGTFPAQYWFLRFPVDLLFHSAPIIITNLKTLPAFGSDHLPILAEFFINKSSSLPKNNLDPKFKEEVNTIIEEGKEAAVEEND